MLIMFSTTAWPQACVTGSFIRGGVKQQQQKRESQHRKPWTFFWKDMAALVLFG
eukprot:m.37278 g.37278  ORF g.37278 m.37278 type:complete len:54 (-) comp16202_c0_seq1:126-287(-)